MRADVPSLIREVRRHLLGRRPPELPPQEGLLGWLRAALAFQAARPVAEHAAERSVRVERPARPVGPSAAPVRPSAAPVRPSAAPVSRGLRWSVAAGLAMAAGLAVAAGVFVFGVDQQRVTHGVTAPAPSNSVGVSSVPPESSGPADTPAPSASQVSPSASQVGGGLVMAVLLPPPGGGISVLYYSPQGVTHTLFPGTRVGLLCQDRLAGLPGGPAALAVLGVGEAVFVPVAGVEAADGRPAELRGCTVTDRVRWGLRDPLVPHAG